MTAPAPDAAAGAVSMPGEEGRGVAATGPRVGPDARRLVEAGALLVMVAWAANFVVVKSAIASAPPIGFAFIRFLLAGLVLLAILRWREGSVAIPRPVVIRLSILGAIGFGIYQILWATALSVTTAGTSALLIATTPIWTVLIAMAMRAEAPHAARFFGAVVGFAGVALVVAGLLTWSDPALVGSISTPSPTARAISGSRRLPSASM